MSSETHGLVRWEARSHAQIYHELHEPVTGSSTYALATTVPWWSEFAADVHEIRSRYESLVNRLMHGSAGASAEAAGMSARLVLRGLTDAHELTCTAGAQRAKLDNLNARLRMEMPEPVAPAELVSGFLDTGRAWLTAPDFDREDHARHDVGERARDLMRDYERAITSPALADDLGGPAAGHRTTTAVDRHIDGPTVPLSAAQMRSMPAGPTGSQPAGADHRPDGAATWGPRFGAGHPAQDSPFPDFGPRGYSEPADVEEQPPSAVGSPPPPREDEPPAPGGRRFDDDPFGLDGEAFPPVIGA